MVVMGYSTGGGEGSQGRAGALPLPVLTGRGWGEGLSSGEEDVAAQS